MKEIHDSPEHFRSCHERWARRTNRDLSMQDRPDDWVWNQCESCIYWLPLRGKFASDWGVCSNEESTFDGIARFAHDGCEQFEQRDLYESDATDPSRP